MNDTSCLASAPDELEFNRLDALSKFMIAGTPPEPRFDKIARLAGDLFTTSMALISLVDKERQRFKAHIGTDIAETSRCVAFCDYTIRRNEVFIVHNALTDHRFANNPLVVGHPHIRFYAGAPLVTSDGFRIGSLCVIDQEPRTLVDTWQRRALVDLAALAMEQIELRRAELARSAMMGFADATEFAFISVNGSGIIQFVNSAVTALFGHSRDEMLGRPVDIIIPERMRNAHHSGMARVVASGQSQLSGKTVEVVACRRDGSEFPIELSLSVWRDEGGMGMGAIIRDIQQRRDRDSRLMRMANNDVLTGLFNRRHFQEVLADVFLRKLPVTVLLLDLDGFKDVNDSLGHGVGDTLLQAIAIRLPSVLPSDAVVARLGGDEFAIMMPELSDPILANGHAATVLGALERPFKVDDHIFQLGASIGFAIAPSHGQDPEELIASADFALYRAKRAGGRAVRIFEPAMRNAAVARRAMQDELLRALQEEELALHYQPQVQLDDNRIIGFEALLRWRHPTRGLIFPSALLPALEASALTIPFGWWVLEEACRQLAEWTSYGLNTFKVAVNLFAAQLRSSTFADQVLDTLQKHDVDPCRIELEITETIALQNDDHTHAAMRQLRREGVGIAFDDFGTGYASLSTLNGFH